MEALAWIGQIADFIGRFIPQWRIVPTNAGAVKFVRGAKAVPLGPGIHWFWPLMTEFIMHPTARQAVDLRAQTLATTDDKTIVIGGMVVYEIDNIEAILAHTFDPDESIRDVSLSVFHDVCCHLSWEEIKAGQRAGTLDRKLRRELRAQLKPFGVRVLKATLTDLAPCRVLKLVQSMAKDGI